MQTLAEDGELDAEVTHRGQSGWKNWKRVSGVLCDRRMNMKIKGKVYRTVVRPALMYGAETWVLKKAQEKKLEVAEMRMLRWMCGVTKLDKIRNERIRGTTKVGGNHKESTRKKVEVVWACGEKRGTLLGPVIFRFKKSNFPFQKKGNSVSIPFHYWQR